MKKLIQNVRKLLGTKRMGGIKKQCKEDVREQAWEGIRNNVRKTLGNKLG